MKPQSKGAFVEDEEIMVINIVMNTRGPFEGEWSGALNERAQGAQVQDCTFCKYHRRRTFTVVHCWALRGVGTEAGTGETAELQNELSQLFFIILLYIHIFTFITDTILSCYQLQEHCNRFFGKRGHLAEQRE